MTAANDQGWPSIMRGMRKLLLLLFALLAGLAGTAQATLLELRQAHVAATLDGQTVEHEVQLPYNWDHVHGARPGSAVFEVPLHLEQTPAEPYAVYFARVGNRAEIWLNGVLLSRLGDLSQFNRQDYAKAPQYVLIPAQLLRRDNVFRIVLSVDGGRRGGLSGLLVGTETEVREHYNRVYRLVVNGSIAVAVFSAVVGVMALLLWFTQVDPGPGAMRRPVPQCRPGRVLLDAAPDRPGHRRSAGFLVLVERAADRGLRRLGVRRGLVLPPRGGLAPAALDALGAPGGGVAAADLGSRRMAFPDL